MTENDEVGDTDVVAELLGLNDPMIEDVSDSERVSAVAVGERVRKSRTALGMFANQLGVQVGLTPDKVSKVESGSRRLSVSEAPRFASALGVSLRYLLRGDVPRPALAMRLLADGSLEGASPARARAVEVLEVEERLAGKDLLAPQQPHPRAVELRIRASLVPEMRSKDEAHGQGRDFAELVRADMGLDRAPIGDMARFLETQFGVDVVLGPFGDAVAGLFAHQDDKALVLANTDLSGGNVRFTLAHELAHYLFGDAREVVEENLGQMYANSFFERRANAFAAHLLLPAAVINEESRGLGVLPEHFTEDSVEARVLVGWVMAAYGASMECVLHHYRELGWMNWDTCNKLKATWSSTQVLSDVAPSMGVDLRLVTSSADVRVPVRLLSAARVGAKTGAIGTATVARLLNVEDDEALFEEYVGYGDDEGASESLSTR